MDYFNRHKQFTQYSRANFVNKKTTSDKPTFRTLNIHAHNGCNLACRGCNHNSNVLSPGSGINVDQMISDMEKILPRIHIWSHISLLGGEPLLEPRCNELLTKLESLVRCRVKLFSNGILLYKNKEWIVDHMKRKTILRISLHIKPTTGEGKLVYKNVHDFIEYAKNKVDLENTLEVSEPWNEKWFDALKYQEGKYYPWEDNDIQKSWARCTAPQLQIYRGFLWKCANIAYLKETLSATNQLEDNIWQKYLQYNPVPTDAPIEDIYKLAESQNKESYICNMCPANPKYFYANKQLDVKKKVVPQFYEPV